MYFAEDGCLYQQFTRCLCKSVLAFQVEEVNVLSQSLSQRSMFDYRNGLGVGFAMAYVMYLLFFSCSLD